MTKPSLFLIDATAFCYRAFYALRGLSTSFGQPTNAIYGFINMLNRILKENRPEYLAVCFDVSRETFRKEKFAEYKKQRPAMPEDLSSQIPFIKQLAAAYGIALFQKEGYEADDLIASLSEEAKKKGVSSVIVSSDKDMLQLVDEQVKVFNPYKDEGVSYDLAAVRERFGVEPSKIVDIIALMGDSVDNIPGVPGIGEKTAGELIKSFGSLDELLAAPQKIKQEKIRAAVSSNLERILLNKELLGLRRDLELNFDLAELKIKPLNHPELVRLFKHLEFKKFLNELEVRQDETAGPKADDLEDKELKGLLKKGDELLLWLDADNLFLGIREKFFCLKQRGENLKQALADSAIAKTGHNLKLAKVSLARQGLELEGLHFDTMLAAHLLDPAKPGYDLADLALDYLGELVNSQTGGLAMLDLISRLKPKLEKELQERKLDRLLVDIEVPLSAVLARMELTGIKIDAAALKKLSGELEEKLIALRDDIYALSGCQFNINSPKQLRDILFERLKLPVVRRSKTGPSTDEEVLRKLSAKHDLPKLLLEYRQLIKLKNTYIDVLPEIVDKHTGRIHTTFNQAATETGRLSSSEPNLQNIPVKSELGRSIRGCIVAFSPDNCLLSCDYSQIELRILAHISEDENLIQAFRDDKDVHRLTASLVYGVEEKEVSEGMRETAKRVNFGIVYGLTFFGLSRDLGIGNDQAQSFIDAYFLRYPRVKEYIERQVRQAAQDGFVSTILGRRRYLPQINSKNQAIRQLAERQAVNTPIQGSASDLIKLAMLEIDREILQNNSAGRMILQIHDELLFDLPEGEADSFARMVRERMENVLKLKVPLKVDIKKGRNWLKMEGI